MITKEQISELNVKWEPFLKGLSGDKHKKYKFARVCEKIVNDNSPNNIKVLLSLARNVFAKSTDFKTTKSKKNKIFIIEYNEEELYNGYYINLDNTLAFIDAVSEMIVEEVDKIGRISYIKIENKKIFLIY